MINLSPQVIEQSQTHKTDSTTSSISNINELSNEILQNIFSNFEKKEILELRQVCSHWNNNALAAFAYKDPIKTNKLNNFLYFLKNNLSEYPNEFQKINSDIKILEMHPKEIIPHFKFLAKYNLETRIAETLKNIRVIDLKNLIKLSKDQNEPYYTSILKAAVVFQELYVLFLLEEDGTSPLLDGFADDVRDCYLSYHMYDINKRALKTDRYDIGIDEAIEFSSLPIMSTKPDDFSYCWSQAKVILNYIEFANRIFPGIIIPPENFDNLDNIDEAIFFIKCAKMCQKALNSNKFKRLVTALQEKQNIIATHFIINYLKLIGKNDRASQIEALLIPGTMQLRENCEKNFLDFWTEEDSTENISQIGKRRKEEHEEQSAKKAKHEL